MSCLNCNELPGDSLVTVSEATQPFCDQCTDANVCVDTIDAQCVIYHSNNDKYSKLENIGMSNLSSVEQILEKIDDMIGTGFSGTSGTSGSGTSGTSGTSATGAAGTSGTSGTSGAAGTSGTSATGAAGTSGTSGANGTSGTSATGAAGTSGTSGANGTSGINGANGTSGTTGTSGTAGTSGTSPSFTLDSGTYTPTLTDDGNVTSATAYQCQYLRVGNVVTVSGRFRLIFTAINVVTKLIISLPIPANFTAEENCGGTACSNSSNSLAGFAIRARAADDNAEFYAVGIGNSVAETYWFTFTYYIGTPI